MFRAGLAPLSESDEALWIIDYKTAHADDADEATAKSTLHSLFAPQLEAYAAIMRQLPGAKKPIRVGLYYPRMSLLDWWPVEGR